MNYRHLMSLLTIIIAIAMTACQDKTSHPSAEPSRKIPARLALKEQTLAPLAADQVAPAKALLKALGATGNIEGFLFLDSEPSESKYSQLSEALKIVATDVKNSCTFRRDKIAPEIEKEKIRVGAQFAFNREIESQGEGCPAHLQHSNQASLTFWSIETVAKSATVRSRAETSSLSAFKDARHIEALGYSEAQFKFRLIEDSENGPLGKIHLRTFGGGHITLNQVGRVNLRVRSEQLSEQNKRELVLRIRAKTPQGQNFSYALQIEMVGTDLKVIKAYVGNVPMTAGEIADLKVATLATRFILSIQ